MAVAARRVGRAPPRTPRSHRRWPAPPRAAADADRPRSLLFIFGLGYAGAGLARLARSDGWAVAGTVRSADKAASLTAAGVPCAVLEDREAVATPPPGIATATHVVVTAPPLPDGRDPVLAALPDLRAAAPHAVWLAYVSSTSVYGSQRGGAWVGEGDELAPDTPAGLARAAAEREWKAWATACDPALPVVCFRAGGIYGPGRSALDAVAAAAGHGGQGGGARRAAPPGAPTSRVHVHDLCRGLLASAACPPATLPRWSVVNAVDGDPAPRAAVMAAAAALLGASGVEGDGGTSPSQPSRGKRVRGEVFAGLLAGSGGLLFPSYREGLAAIAGGDGRPFCM